MSRIDRLADRDGWVCWLCEQPIDPHAGQRSPWSASADHVVPKSRGGSSDLDNLRLAHRRCNGRRGNELPELEWPARFAVIDAAPLWQSLARIARRRRHEVVALVPTRELAEEASAWVVVRAERFLGGSWTAAVNSATDGADACVVRLGVDPDSEVADPGRPVAGERPRRRRR